MKKTLRIRDFLVPHSLKFQLLSRTLILMALMLLVIGLLQYILMREFLYQNKATSIQAQLRTAPPEALEQLMHNTSTENRLPFIFMPDASVAIIDPDGKFTSAGSYGPNAVEPVILSSTEYQSALLDKHKLFYKIVKSSTGDEQLVVLQPIMSRDRSGELIQISISTKQLRDMLISQLLTFLLLSLLALIAGLLAFIPVLRKTLVPLSNMVNAVEQIDAGNLDQQFPETQGQIEIDRLSGSFNGMLKRLKTSFEAEKEAKEQMRRFVADASHELRTPLTSIHGFLEVLLRGAMNQPDKLSKSLQCMLSESERMKKLVQDLLLLAKLDRSPNIVMTEGDIGALLPVMEPQLKLLAGNRTVRININSQTMCRFDEDKVKQVILNVFQNAVQYTNPETGVIEISLDLIDKQVQLSVKDNGAGIAEMHLPFLFNRFYRSDASRTRKYGGSGLGLSITKSIVEHHGGTVYVESTLGQGSTFYVQLPAIM